MTTPYDRGVQAYNGSKYEEAANQFGQAIQINPTSNAFAWRGVCYEKLGKYKEAIQDYDKAIELDPKNAVAYNNRALVNRTQFRKNAEALKDFSKAIELDPKMVDAYNNRAILFNIFLDPGKAIEDINQAIQLNPSYWTLYSTLANIQLAQGKYPEAEYNARYCVDKNPHAPRGYFVIAKVLEYKQEYRTAIKTIEHYLTLNHNDAMLVEEAKLLMNNLKRRAWMSHRLLWIARLKNSEDWCPMSALPPEIIRHIILILDGQD
mmetsp:Transcript_14040/g.19528  ORF Transcript_14040/g.19528 Transcript_14040/m.19528 type:complete len:263 (+) Transcript_14040:213-1001(+)